MKTLVITVIMMIIVSSCQRIKKELGIESGLSGKYSCSDCLYKSIEFKGESTVVVSGSFIMNFEFPTSYVKDGKFIRIKTDKEDLLLEVIDDHTLKGEGWAAGTYIKK